MKAGKVISGIVRIFADAALSPIHAVRAIYNDERRMGKSVTASAFSAAAIEGGMIPVAAAVSSKINGTLDQGWVGGTPETYIYAGAAFMIANVALLAGLTKLTKQPLEKLWPATAPLLAAPKEVVPKI